MDNYTHSTENEKIILRQRKKIEELSKKINALEQENALLEHEIDRMKRREKRSNI